MSSPVIHLGLRDGTISCRPAAGLVDVPGFSVRVDSRDHPDVLAEPGLEGREPFSRYVQARAAGDDRLVGSPRSSCAASVTAASWSARTARCAPGAAGRGPDRAHRLAGLGEHLDPRPAARGRCGSRGRRVAGGAAGGRGVGQGPLGTRPFVERLRHGRGRIAGGGAGLGPARRDPDPVHAAGNCSARAAASAISWRPPAAERDYWESTGFVPGIHLVTLKRRPSRPTPLCPARCWRHWSAPSAAGSPGACSPTPHRGLLHELTDSARLFGDDWMPYGTSATPR